MPGTVQRVLPAKSYLSKTTLWCVGIGVNWIISLPFPCGFQCLPLQEKECIYFSLLEVGLARWFALAHAVLPGMIMVPWKTFSGSASFALGIPLTFFRERTCPRQLPVPEWEMHKDQNPTGLESGWTSTNPQAHKQEKCMFSAVSHWDFWIVQHKALLYIKLIQHISLLKLLKQSTTN